MKRAKLPITRISFIWNFTLNAFNFQMSEIELLNELIKIVNTRVHLLILRIKRKKKITENLTIAIEARLHLVTST